MERSRAMTDPERIDTRCARLTKLIKNLAGSFALNMRETGFPGFVDAKVDKVIVPPSCSSESIQISPDRRVNRATLVGGIAADGAPLILLITLTRKTIEAEPFLCGASPTISYRCINKKIDFMCPIPTLDHLELCLFLAQRHAQTGCKGITKLIFDGRSCHGGASPLVAFQQKEILSAHLPHHTSDQTQPLDQGVFGPLT
jgi:hypothetical protein